MSIAFTSRSGVPLRLLPTTALVFSGYLVVGLETSTVPTFVHQTLGLSTLLAGCAISAQFVATLLNRPFAGRFTDRFGARASLLCGLAVCAVASLLFSVADPRNGFTTTQSWICIVISRLLLGVAISWISTAGTIWGIDRIGSDHTAQVVAWSGVASYGSLAFGAPMGLAIQQHWGVGGLGFMMAVLAVITLLLGLPLPGPERTVGVGLRFGSVLTRIAPFGLTLALAASGFGSFLALVTLFFENLHWRGAGVPLTVYGVCFVAVRIILSREVERVGPYRVALGSIGLEIAGLLLLAVAPTPWVALAAAGMIGTGFSLVFPALCVEALTAVQPRNHASAVSLYTGFIELSFAVTSAAAGLLAGFAGFRSSFAVAALLASFALGSMAYLERRSRP